MVINVSPSLCFRLKQLEQDAVQVSRRAVPRTSQKAILTCPLAKVALNMSMQRRYDWFDVFQREEHADSGVVRGSLWPGDVRGLDSTFVYWFVCYPHPHSPNNLVERSELMR